MRDLDLSFIDLDEQTIDLQSVSDAEIDEYIRLVLKALAEPISDGSEIVTVRAITREEAVLACMQPMGNA